MTCADSPLGIAYNYILDVAATYSSDMVFVNMPGIVYNYISEAAATFILDMVLLNRLEV